MKKVIMLLGLMLCVSLGVVAISSSVSAFSLPEYEDWAVTKIWNNTDSVVSGGTSLDIYNDTPYIAAIDDDSGDGLGGLIYAEKVGLGGDCDNSPFDGSDAWECAVIDINGLGGGDAVRQVGIKVDSGGRHVVYTDGTDLYYSKCTSNCGNTAGWSTNTKKLYSNAEYGQIDINPTNNNPSIIYTTNNDLYLAEYVGGTGGSGCFTGVTDWTCTAIESTATVENNPSIVFDSSGNEHVVFGDGTNTVYATETSGDCSNTGWNCNEISGSTNTDGVDITLNSNNPRIAYWLSTNDDIYYTECDSSCTSSGWSSPTLISEKGDIPSISVDTTLSREFISFAIGGADLWVAENVNPSAHVPSDKIIPTAHAFSNSGVGCNNDITIGSPFWTCHWAHSNTSPVVAHTSLHLSVPSTSFGTGDGLYFTEQDLTEAGEAIPELPSSTIWKVVIALLSLGLVVGIAAFTRRKKK